MVFYRQPAQQVGLEHPSEPSKLQLIAATAYGEDPSHLSSVIYDSFRSYKNDRCAIFMHADETGSFLASSGIDAEHLNPDTNIHWQGVQTGLKRKWKRIIIGDYPDWFSWYMKWQRFNAFHTVVLFRPISRVAREENRGYIDGLLTRLLNKPSLHRLVVIEEEALWPIVEQWVGGSETSISTNLVSNFGKEEIREAILATLYGTRLSHTDLADAIGRTLSAKLNPDWRPILQRMEISSLVRRRSNFRVLAEAGMKMVQSLSNVSIKLAEQEPRYDDEVFQLSRKREHLKTDDTWIEDQILRLVDDRGWFTISVLYDHIRPLLEEILHSSTPPPKAIMAQLNRSPGDPPMVNLPSKAVLRRIAERMVEERWLARSTWFREVGRPSTAYHRLGSRALFDEYHRCGQCAFYAPMRRRCRLWWLLDRAIGPDDRRWSKGGLHPLSPFEFYKMKNSWRISPRSSACTWFTDKKKDHSRKEVPEVCEICNNALPESRSSLVVCKACRTRYATVKRHVRVSTAYEHKFEWSYRAIAGRDSTSDATRLEEERQTSPSRAMEQIYYDAHRPASDSEESRTLTLYPGDTMLVKDGVLYVFKRRNVEAVPLAGTTLVDNDVIGEEQLKSLEDAGATVRKVSGPKPLEDQRPLFDISPMVERAVVERPELVRAFAMAMARSAIHATERIATMPSVQAEVQPLIREQRRLFERLQKSGPKGFLTSEALIMKQYWICFNLPLRPVFERFGPRKRFRFVRESVTAPSGRARGYSAVDAAINYLHQRRLSKCRQINMQLGLDYNPGEGFLHRRRWNSNGLGLLLDLIDPFKFADREKLLEAISDSRVNWRDFNSATDRYGIRFYYPKEAAVAPLEGIGAEADVLVVEYAGRKLPLMEAYQSMVSDLIESLQRVERPFTPFVF